MNFGISHYLPKCEWILVFAKPKFRLKSRGGSALGDVWDILPEKNNPHPAPFPLALPLRALEGLPDELDIVLDPFCGSGTTGAAALQTGRKFIGIDQDAGYLEMTRQRLIF